MEKICIQGRVCDGRKLIGSILHATFTSLIKKSHGDLFCLLVFASAEYLHLYREQDKNNGRSLKCVSETELSVSMFYCT